MKKEWFEPGPDGVSPFEREFYKGWVAGVGTGTAIAAAFRTPWESNPWAWVIDMEGVKA